MASDYPTVRQITTATPYLRQAYELAIRVDATDSFAPDDQCERERRQFLFQMEQVASRLGFDLVERGTPRIETPDNVTSMSR